MLGFKNFNNHYVHIFSNLINFSLVLRLFSDVFRSRSRATVASLPISEDSRGRRARSKSRPRVLYAPEGEIIRNSGTFYNLR